MVSKNKFGFEPLETKSVKPRADRSVGPMGAAVREAAESLQEATEAKVEQRRRNADDAKAYRLAQDEGRVLVTVALSDISTGDLPRDRLDLDAVAASDEMEELKASIRARGQKEPVEVYRGSDGNLQLKKGWRRFTALSQLFAETGEARFATVIARIETGAEDRLTRYVDMVEENVVREDLTFAEMAQVAITAASDEAIKESDADVLVGRLYSALHKMKRSYIRSFVYLLSTLGDALQWPKDVPRNLGVEVARALKASDQADGLREALHACQGPQEQGRVLARFLEGDGPRGGDAPAPREPRQKFEFHLGATKVTARRGECRIVSAQDYAAVPRQRLERAVKAFEEALREGNPRVTPL